MKDENKDSVLIKDQENVLEEVLEQDDSLVEEEFIPSVKGKRRSSISRIFNIILWILLIVWIAICLIDFIRVKGNQDPRFCINKKTVTYSDGKVESCMGLGYKVYRYERDSFSGLEFGPFWSKDRTAQNK